MGQPRIYWYGPLPGTPSVLTKQNKNMPGKVTALDGDLACDTGVAVTPSDHGYIIVSVNGNIVVVGDNDKTKDCYFSGDGGTNARAIQDIVASDKLYWNGSIAGYELDTDDRIDFNYDIQ